MEVKKGDKLILSHEKLKNSLYDLAISGAALDGLRIGNEYVVRGTTKLLGTFPAVLLEGKGYWHPIDIFTIKNEKMSTFNVHDIVVHKATAKEYTVRGTRNTRGIDEVIFYGGMEWQPASDYELVSVKNEDILREGDEVEAINDVTATVNGRYIVIAEMGKPFPVYSVTPDGKFITLPISSQILPSSLFRKVKSKKKEEKITIGTGTKVAKVTVTKDAAIYELSFAGKHMGSVKMVTLKRVYEATTKVYGGGGGLPVHFTDKDAKVFLIGCSDVGFMVSLREIEMVLNIAKGLD